MWTHPDAERVEAGRVLGHDLYRYRRRVEEPLYPQAVCEGYAQAGLRRIATEVPDRYVRKWLQLRLNAFARDRVVDVAVTPALLREIDVIHCPVTREPLTQGELNPSDWSVDRLNNDGAYATNNLAVMSTRANRAKGAKSFHQVLKLSETTSHTDGLSPVEWLRLAGLMLGPCFANRPALAPLMPLLTPIPLRSVRTATQLIQHALVTHTARPADKNRLVKHFRPATPDERAAHRLRAVADAMHEGQKGLQHPGDAWLAPAAMPALAAWKASVGAPQWAIAGHIAGQLVGATVVPPAYLRSWCLPTRGRWVCSTA